MTRSHAAIVVALAVAVVIALAAVARADAPHEHGLTAEVEVGGAMVGDPGGFGFAPGLGGGVGVFVHERVALSLRVAGAVSSTTAIGVAGPHAQIWLGRAWLGVGGGLGVVTACSCVEGGVSEGFEGRVGVALHATRTGRLNLSVAMQAIHPFAYPSTGTLTLALGYQTF